MQPNGGVSITLKCWRLEDFPEARRPRAIFHQDLQIHILVHGDDFFIVGRREWRKHTQSLLRGAHELSRVVTLGPLGPESSQSRTASFLGRTLTLRPVTSRVRARPAARLPCLEGFEIDQC